MRFVASSPASSFPSEGEKDMPAALIALQAIAAAASLIASLKSIFDDAHDKIESQLNDILTQLQGLQGLVIQGTAQILEAIDGIRRQIDEDTALTSISLVDRAFFSDLAVFNDKEQAMGNSFQATDRLFRETDIVFATSFMYVVNLRLAVIRDFDPSYFCRQPFQEEFQRYRARLQGWSEDLNSRITQLHTVSVELIRSDINEGTQQHPVVTKFWAATHFRNGVPVASFEGPEDDLSGTARQHVEQQANASRLAGIEADRRQFGAIDIEKTMAAWSQAFELNLRLALLSQVLNRTAMAVDFNPRGVMVDGRILSSSHSQDPRSFLLEVLRSREFRGRVQRSLDAFMNGDDNRLVAFAYRRLFDRDVTEDEAALLKSIVTHLGFAGFLASLLYSEEYEKRHGRGLPAGEQSIADELGGQG
jgi:hypothetical protein